MRRKFLLKVMILSLLFVAMGGGYLYSQDGVTIVTTETGLATALAAGGNVELGDDIVVTNTIEIPPKKKVTLDLNGKSITADGKIYPINNDGELTIYDSGEGGTIEGLGLSTGKTNSNNRSATSKLTINGGIFRNVYPDEGAALYVHMGIVEISGGKFYGQNVAISNTGGFINASNCFIDGYNYAVNATASTVISDAEISGKCIINDYIETTDVTFYQARIGEATDYTSYKTLEDAIKAAKSGDEIYVFAGTWDKVPAMKAGITINGEVDGDRKVVLNGTLGGTLENLTLKNLHIKGANAQRWAYAKGDYLNFENVTFEATSVYAIHFDGIAESTNLLYKDCTIIGWAAMGGSPKSCEFENCTIKDNGTYGVIRTYFDATIEGCTFDIRNANPDDVYQDGIHAVSGADVVVTECTNIIGDNGETGDMKDIVNVSGSSTVEVDGVLIQNPAKVGENYYATIQDAIVAAAPNGTVELLADVTVDKWIMFSERLSIGNGNIITKEINGLTIDGNNHKLTINSIESAGNGNRLFYDATNLNIQDLTIECVDAAANQGGIGLTSGTISNVNFIGGGPAILPGTGEITVIGCTFKTNGTSIYYEEARDNLVVTGNTFENHDGVNVILLRGNTEFTNNIINSGRTVNVVSGSPVVSGNDFNDVRFKVYNAAEATISNNTINNLEFNDESVVYSTFTANTLSDAAQAALDAMIVAKIGEVGYCSLQKAIDAAQNGDVITLVRDCAENVTITQKADVNFTIDGAQRTMTMTGAITVDGQSGQIETAGLTIQNVKFDASNITTEASINLGVSGNTASRYVSNLTVEGCTFIGKDQAKVAVKSYTGGDKNLTITNCTVDATMHSLLQVNNVEGKLTLTGCTVKSKNGVNLNSCTNVEMTGCNFDVQGYALRSGVASGGNLGVAKTYVLENNILMSACNDGDAVIMFRASSVDANFSMTKNVVKGTTHISGNTTDTKISADANYWDGKEAPVATTPIVVNSYYTDDALTNLVRIPMGDNFTAYTREDAIWGEVGGNAVESFVIKVLDADGIVMGTTSLNNVNNIIDGSVYVTWSLKLDAASNTDSYWTMNWTTAPNINKMPAKVELWVDGVKVSGGDVVLNAPDNLKKINAANIDADGNILAYRQTLADAVNNGDNVAILAPGTYDVPTGKDLTITGAVNGVVFDNIEAKNMGGANVTFNKVTFDYYPNVNYTGLQHSGNLVYNNCTFEGQPFLYGTSETFNNCTFNQNSADAYNVWTYGAAQVAFNECTFNSAGKSVLVYNEGACATDLTVTDTKFIASATVDDKAAIEIDCSLMPKGTSIVINGVDEGKTTATGFGTNTKSGSSLWNDKKVVEGAPNGGTSSEVIIDDVVVKEPALMNLAGEGTEENPYLISNLEDLIWFRYQVNSGVNYYKGKYIALAADIDLNGENWVGIGTATADHGFMGNFDGKTYKIKNLTINNPALDSDGYAYAGLFGVTEGTDKDNQNTIKNLTIENVTISTTGHIVSAAIAYPYYTIVDNVKVCGNITITGGDYTSGVLAYTRRCVNASNLTIDGNEGSAITGNKTVGGVISDIQMNDGLTAVYNNFNAEGIKVTGNMHVGGISGIISAQTLNTCSVKNVTLVCSDNRVGIVSGSLGVASTISNATYENVTGAAAIIGATYDGGKAVEAKIGDTYYATLQAALNAVVEGTSNGTVELISDIDLTDVNWTPVGTETKPFIGSFNGNEHTIKNLNIVETEAAEGKAYVGLFGYAKNATIKNVVFENVNLNIACLDIDHSQGHIGAVAGSLEGTSTIENVTVKGDVKVESTFDANGASRVAVVAGGNSYGNVTMKNVHVIANESSYLKANNNVGALAGQLQGKSVFENCSSNIDVTGKKFFAGGIIGLAAGDQTFTNCHTTGDVTITAGREGNANDHYRVGGIAGGWADGKNNVCTLTDCSYTGEISGTNADGSVAAPLDYAGYVGRGYTLANCAGSKVVIDGVEYVQAYDDVYGVYEINGVLTINTADALEAVAENPSGSVSIVLGSDITLTETIKINAGQTRTATDNVVTLDLNGRTITGTDNATGSFALIEIQPGAELIINDSSDDKSGKITLTSTNNREWNAYSSVISNQRGKLTVNSGTIEHLGGTDMAYAIDNLTNGTGTYAETVINGGTIKSTYRAIRQFLNGTEAQNILTVNGGIIEGANKSIWMQDPSKNANTGTLTVGENAQLKGDVYLYVTDGSTSWPVEVSIAAAALAEGSEVISANVPAGYEVKEMNDVYGVYHGVAKIDNVLYESLAEAATAAQNGETIELLWQEGQAPIAMKASLYGKNVTIKGTAKVDWSKDWLFVGRGGAGDATLTFDNAKLTSNEESLANGTYGIHVSAKEGNDVNKNYGKVIFKNSDVQLSYLANRNNVEVDGGKLYVHYGFWVGGRPSTETPDGKEGTATMDIKNGAVVEVKNHNGMGVGHEGNGVMNITSSTFKYTGTSFNLANEENSSINVYGESTIEITTLEGGSSIDLMDGAIVKNSTVGGDAYIAGNVIFRGDNTFNMITDYGDYYSQETPSMWTVEEGASLTLTKYDRYGLGYGDKVTVVGNIENALEARASLTDEDASVNMYGGLVGMTNSAATNAENSFTATNAYLIFGVNGDKSFGNKPEYYGKYTFTFNNSVVTANGFKFYEDNGTSTVKFSNSDLLVNGVLMTNDASSSFTFENSVVLSKAENNGTDDKNQNAGVMTLTNTQFTYSAAFTNVGTLNLDLSSKLTAPSVTGNGIINIDATDFDGNEICVISANMASFEGVINVEGAHYMKKDNGIYVTGAQGTLTKAYTSATGYWGECGGNANESFVLKFYNDGTYMGQTSLNDIDNIIDGDVYVTWSIDLNIDPNAEGYWAMSWDIRPTLAMQPNRVEQWIDGVKVAECAVEPNWADNIFPVVAAVTGENDVILSYVNNTAGATLKDAFAAGGNIAILRDFNLAESVTVPADKTVVLNLNGKTMSQEKACTASYEMINNKGNLTIKGNGKISFTDTSAGDPNFGWGSYTVRNEGDLVVENGTIEHLGAQSFATHCIMAIFQYSGSSTINGGTISTPNYRSARLWKGDMTINGGTFDGQLWVQSVDNTAKLTINGGNFSPNGNDASSVFVGNTNYDAAFTVTGGTFETKIGCNGADNLTGDRIIGGLFTQSAVDNTSTDLLGEGFVFNGTPNANGYYTVIQVAGTQTRELVAGWSWFSTYIKQGNDGLSLLQDSLNPNGVEIKSREGFTRYYPGLNDWSPSQTLTSVSTTKMYMIKTSAAHTLELEGDFEDENIEITIAPGWNWIGYPVHEEGITMQNALLQIQPKHGDWIKSQTFSAQYIELLGRGAWLVENGQTFVMNPGEGYKYYSNNPQEFSFTYTTDSRSSSEATMSPIDCHWIADATQYSGNMTVLAMLSIDNEIVNGDYEIAAFANGECRGSARPIYVEALDAYVLLMTIHGEEVEELTFKYYDVNYGTEYELNNTMVYSNDAIVGTIEEPYMFNLGILNIDESSVENISIYPNPTTTGKEINLQAVCDKVEVFNALGVKVAEYTNVDSIDAIETAGIYVIRVTIDGNARNCRLIVK